MNENIKNKMLSVVDNIHWQLEDLEKQLKRCINDVNEKNIKIRHL